MYFNALHVRYCYFMVNILVFWVHDLWMEKSRFIDMESIAILTIVNVIYLKALFGD